MSVREAAPEQLAQLFHHYHHALSADFGIGEQRNARCWGPVSPQERSRLIAAARLALLELSDSEREEQNSRRYFAKPGEAEWGC